MYCCRRDGMHACTGRRRPCGQIATPLGGCRLDYPAKAVPYQRAKPQQALAAATGVFEDSTTHRNDFKDPGPDARPAPMAAANRTVSVPRSGEPFAGSSLYKDDFRRHPLVRSMPVVPTSKGIGAGAAFGTGRFDDATMYRTTYTAKGGLPAERMKPSDRDATVMPDGWYDGVLPTTEYGTSYFGKDGRPASRAGPTTGPSAGMHMGSGPFDGATTYNHTFRPVTAPTPYTRSRPANVTSIPMGDGAPFDGRSMYNGEYTAKALPPAYSRVKPSNAFEPSQDKFVDDTTHRTAFKDFGAVAVVHPAGRNGANSSGMGAQGPFEVRALEGR